MLRYKSVNGAFYLTLRFFCCNLFIKIGLFYQKLQEISLFSQIIFAGSEQLRIADTICFSWRKVNFPLRSLGKFSGFEILLDFS